MADVYLVENAPIRGFLGPNRWIGTDFRLLFAYRSYIYKEKPARNLKKPAGFSLFPVVKRVFHCGGDLFSPRGGQLSTPEGRGRRPGKVLSRPGRREMWTNLRLANRRKILFTIDWKLYPFLD